MPINREEVLYIPNSLLMRNEKDLFLSVSPTYSQSNLLFFLLASQFGFSLFFFPQKAHYLNIHLPFHSSSHFCPFPLFPLLCPAD